MDLEKTWEESEPQTPLVCILSIGSDPSPQITALAKSKEIRNAHCSITVAGRDFTVFDNVYLCAEMSPSGVAKLSRIRHKNPMNLRMRGLLLRLS